MKVMTIEKRWGALSLTQESSNDATILRCLGKLVAGREAAGLSAAVQSQSRHNVVIDLAAVSAADAGGLGTLVALYRWAAINGVRLAITNPNRRVRSVMQHTGLTYLLENEPISVARFKPVELCRCSA